jgi:NAD(P)H-flavin reductase
LEQAVTTVDERIMEARLRRAVLLSDKTKHLEFEVCGKDRFNFVPGQFVSVREPRAVNPDGQEGSQPERKYVTRAYSLASAPRANNTFDLCLNRVDEGFMSNHMCDLNEGDAAHIHGPYGNFAMRDDRHDSIFVATGTGVAPFRGMVEWLFSAPEHHNGREFWLVYGTRYPEDIYYREEFESIAARFPNFHYVVTLSRAPESWTGHRGYVQDRVREIVGTRKDMNAYICGLNIMVSAVRKLLKEDLNWDRKHIVYERYD